jgi:hypothetical protein
MQNRYILALIKSETFNEAPQDANEVARRDQPPLDEQRNQNQPTQQPNAEADQLSFAFAS